MAGANLEIFRFGFYVFFPIAIMFHYGKPEWYDKHVLPVRDRLFPPLEKTNRPPTDPHGIRSEIARMKAERLAKLEARPSPGVVQPTQSMSQNNDNEPPRHLV